MFGIVYTVTEVASGLLLQSFCFTSSVFRTSYFAMANKYFRDHDGDACFADGDSLLMLIDSVPAEIHAQLSPKAAFKHIIVNPKKSK